MITVKNLVLDVLKPHKPNILEFGRIICADKSIEDAEISVYAVDEHTESLKIIINGKNIDFERVKKFIESNGGVIHSMDKVVLSRKGPESASIPEQISKFVKP